MTPRQRAKILERALDKVLKVAQQLESASRVADWQQIRTEHEGYVRVLRTLAYEIEQDVSEARHAVDC